MAAAETEVAEDVIEIISGLAKKSWCWQKQAADGLRNAESNPIRRSLDEQLPAQNEQT